MVPFLDIPRRARFDPLRLPGLAAWCDASDSSTVLTTVSPDVPATTGQTVRRWVSRHNPAVFWDQGTLANQPTFTNPTTGLTFNGTSSFMDGVSTMAGIFRNRTQAHVFIVAQDTNPTAGTFRHDLIGFSQPTAVFYAIRTVTAPGAFCSGGRRTGADLFVEIVSATATNNTLNLLDTAFRYSAGNMVYSINGAQAATGNFASGAGNSGDVDATSVIIGVNGVGGSLFFPGNIREIIICNEPLTDAQILSTRRYLQRKHSTPALP